MSRHQPFNLLVLQHSNSCVDEYGGRRGVKVRPVKWRWRSVKQNKFHFHLKSGGGFSMSTVVIFSATVFSSASKYRSIKYSQCSQRRWLNALPGKVKASLKKVRNSSCSQGRNILDILTYNNMPLETKQGLVSGLTCASFCNGRDV